MTTMTEPREVAPVGATITVYTKPACPQCTATKRTLTKLGVPHTVVDVSQSPEGRAAVQALGYQAAPVVVAGSEHWAGFRPDRLRALASAQAA